MNRSSGGGGGGVEVPPSPNRISQAFSHCNFSISDARTGTPSSSSSSCIVPLNSNSNKNSDSSGDVREYAMTGYYNDASARARIVLPVLIRFRNEQERKVMLDSGAIVPPPDDSDEDVEKEGGAGSSIGVGSNDERKESENEASPEKESESQSASESMSQLESQSADLWSSELATLGETRGDEMDDASKMADPVEAKLTFKCRCQNVAPLKRARSGSVSSTTVPAGDVAAVVEGVAVLSTSLYKNDCILFQLQVVLRAPPPALSRSLHDVNVNINVNADVNVAVANTNLLRHSSIPEVGEDMEDMDTTHHHQDQLDHSGTTTDHGHGSNYNLDCNTNHITNTVLEIRSILTITSLSKTTDFLSKYRYESTMSFSTRPSSFHRNTHDQTKENNNKHEQHSDDEQQMDDIQLGIQALENGMDIPFPDSHHLHAHDNDDTDHDQHYLDDNDDDNALPPSFLSYTTSSKPNPRSQTTTHTLPPTPLTVYLRLVPALRLSIREIGGSRSCTGSTLVSLIMSHSNVHNEDVTVTNIAFHPGHSRLYSPPTTKHPNHTAANNAPNRTGLSQPTTGGGGSAMTPTTTTITTATTSMSTPQQLQMQQAYLQQAKNRHHLRSTSTGAASNISSDMDTSLSTPSSGIALNASNAISNTNLNPNGTNPPLTTLLRSTSTLSSTHSHGTNTQPSQSQYSNNHNNISNNNSNNSEQKSMPGGQNSVINMSQHVRWGYASGTAPSLPLTLKRHESVSTVIQIHAGENMKSRCFQSPICVSAVVGTTADKHNNVHKDKDNNNTQNKHVSQHHQFHNDPNLHHSAVLVSADAKWTTGKIAVGTADAFRVDLSLPEPHCIIGAQVVISIKVMNLSQEPRDLMLLMAKNEDPDNINPHQQYFERGVGSVSGGGTSVSSPSLNRITTNGGQNGSGSLLPPHHPHHRHTHQGVNTAIVSEVNGYTFGVWGLGGSDDDGTTRHHRDHELLAVDAALLLGEVKGQHSIEAELRFVPLREGMLDVPNLKLYDRLRGQWYNCVHMLRLVAAAKQ